MINQQTNGGVIMQGKANEVVNALTEKVIDLMKKHGSQWTKPFANKTSYL